MSRPKPANPALSISDTDLASALEQIGTEVDHQPLRSSALARIMRETFHGSDAGGAWDWRMAYDLMQAAAVQVLLRGDGAAGDIAAAKLLASRLLTETRRSEQQIRLQQFSTPLPFATMVVRAAAIRQGERLARDNERAGLIPQRFCHHVAVDLDQLLRMDREGLFEIAQDIVARRQGTLDELILRVHRLKPTFQQTLTRRDHLDDASLARRQIVLDCADDGGCLHAHQEMVEEALFRALEAGLGRGACGRGIGLWARLSELRRVAHAYVAYGLLAPLVHGVFGFAAGLFVHQITGFSGGGVVLLAVMAASSSDISGPPTLRGALPEANPSSYVGTSTGLGTPVAILSIPLWIILADMFIGV